MMTEKDFWLIFRRALLMIVKAIERRYMGTKSERTNDDTGIDISYR